MRDKAGAEVGSPGSGTTSQLQKNSLKSLSVHLNSGLHKNPQCVLKMYNFSFERFFGTFLPLSYSSRAARLVELLKRIMKQ